MSVAFRNGQTREFDEVVIATHSDEALAMLGDPTEDERSVLGALPYRDNEGFCIPTRVCSPTPARLVELELSTRSRVVVALP